MFYVFICHSLLQTFVVLFLKLLLILQLLLLLVFLATMRAFRSLDVISEPLSFWPHSRDEKWTKEGESAPQTQLVWQRILSVILLAMARQLKARQKEISFEQNEAIKIYLKKYAKKTKRPWNMRGKGGKRRGTQCSRFVRDLQLTIYVSPWLYICPQKKIYIDFVFYIFLRKHSHACKVCACVCLCVWVWENCNLCRMQHA